MHINNSVCLSTMKQLHIPSIHKNQEKSQSPGEPPVLALRHWYPGLEAGISTFGGQSDWGGGTMQLYCRHTATLGGSDATARAPEPVR